ncbi:MAG: Gfo/Idh/MocA family protein, partial [Rhizobiaceae bacterium]
LGAGYFSQFHRDGWQRIENAELVGAADQRIDLARKTGLPAFSNLQQMLEEVRPDLLDIITPPPSHMEAIQTALENGIAAIICQKPFCTSLQEAQEATRLAEEAKVPLIVHENFRFQPWYREMAKVISEGRLGRIHQLTFRMRTGDGQGPEAYLARQPYFQKMKKFLVHETAVHWIDVFQFLLGPVKAVYADLRKMNPVIEGEDAAIVIFEMVDDVRAVFDGNRHLDHATSDPRKTFGEALLEGTEGTLVLRGDGSLHVRTFGQMEEDTVLLAREWSGFSGDCVHSLQAHVIAALKGESEFENTAREYLRVIEIENAIYQSAATGQKQEI